MLGAIKSAYFTFIPEKSPKTLQVETQDKDMEWIFFLSTVICLLGRSQELTDTEIAVFTAKGKVTFEETTNSNNREIYVISSDGIPVTSTSKSENSLDAEHEYSILRDPKLSSSPICLSSGPIAMTIDGVALFGPLTSSGYNAVEGDSSEAVGFDECSGHNNQFKTYHHHMIPTCLYNAGVDELLGVAFDGFPIYGPRSSCIDSTRNATAADLDECHGIETGTCSYRYIITYDFPYILGCYKGRIVDNSVRNRGNKQCVYVDQVTSDEETYHLWNGNPGKICSCRPDGGDYSPAEEWETPTSTSKRSYKKANKKYKTLENLLKKWLKQNN